MTPKEIARICRDVGLVLNKLRIEEAMTVLTYSMVCVLRQVPSENRPYLLLDMVHELVDELGKVDNEDELDQPGQKRADSPWGWK